MVTFIAPPPPAHIQWQPVWTSASLIHLNSCKSKLTRLLQLFGDFWWVGKRGIWNWDGAVWPLSLQTSSVEREVFSLEAEEEEEKTLRGALVNHWQGKKALGHRAACSDCSRSRPNWLTFIYIYLRRRIFRKCTIWKHAQEHKDQDSHLRAAGGYGLHVYRRGDGSLGCAQPAGAQSQWDLRGGPLRPVEAVQEAHLHQLRELQGGAKLRTHQPARRWVWSALLCQRSGSGSAWMDVVYLSLWAARWNPTHRHGEVRRF